MILLYLILHNKLEQYRTQQTSNKSFKPSLSCISYAALVHIHQNACWTKIAGVIYGKLDRISHQLSLYTKMELQYGRHAELAKCGRGTSAPVFGLRMRENNSLNQLVSHAT